MTDVPVLAVVMAAIGILLIAASRPFGAYLTSEQQRRGGTVVPAAYSRMAAVVCGAGFIVLAVVGTLT